MAMSNRTKAHLGTETSGLPVRLAQLRPLHLRQLLGETMPSKLSRAERKRAEEALQASETRYRRLFETAKDGILLLDAVSGKIADVNPFLIELLGYTREELLEKKLWEIGPFKDVVASQTAFLELQRRKYIRYEALPLETKQGARVAVEFVSNLYEVNGKKVIQCNVRDISEGMQAKDNLRKANAELLTLVGELRKHDREMKQINHMNDLLQTCKTHAEAYRVIALAAGELFPGPSGGLAILHDSGQHLETFARWGDEPLLELVFPLEDCWAMRRGQPHEVADPQARVICRHFVHPPQAGYLCLPLVVRGETLGLFYLDLPAGMSPEQALSWRQLAVTVSEGIKLSLSNLKLREIMREQATHDPLTGLFNRRYLDDTLARELIHAQRHNNPTSIAMLDIDHFKRFNDTFGHEAGDLVLRELGSVLRANARKSDIACRFGGEEFVLVLLDSPLEASRQHLEKICSQVKALQVRYDEQLLGTLTLSVGIVEASEHDLAAEELLRAADKALYAAKRAGRDRIVAFGDLLEINRETRAPILVTHPV
jgi:diguanylate cyclase (GGDEF)-like protein/PAS domain S-box-containing protein